MNPLHLIEQADKQFSEKFDWKASKNPVVRLSGLCYNASKVKPVAGLSLAFSQVRLPRTIIQMTARNRSGRGFHPYPYLSCSSQLLASAYRWLPVSAFSYRCELLRVSPFPYFVFKVLPHSVLLHYSNLTKISQNCVVKSREMVATLSHKIGTTLSYRVYATLNRATLLTRSGVMSG